MFILRTTRDDTLFSGCKFDHRQQMPNSLLERCPNCDLVLLSGAIFDACDKKETYGPILGLHSVAEPENATAGYVGMGSIWLGDEPRARYLYRCPRCKTDCLVVVDE